MILTRTDIEKVQKKAHHVKALVIGDTMLDKYIIGHVDRISPEAPVPVVMHHSTQYKAGGAANVAFNLASWGCETTLIGLCGHDPSAKILSELLSTRKVTSHLKPLSGRPTTVKTRVVASSHQLLRIDEESTEYLVNSEEDELVSLISEVFQNNSFDLVILQDYNKGMLTERVIGTTIQLAKSKGAFVAVDPKNMNFFSYLGADLFKPNLREASEAAKKTLIPEELDGHAAEWQKGMALAYIAITLGAQGIYLRNGTESLWMKPDRAVDVVDVCGAGDAVVCSLALGLLSGLNLKKSGYLANITGAYVCSHSGVVVTDPEAIKQWV